MVILTPEQRVQKNSVSNCYGDFWNHIRFRRGWARPAFTKADVQDYLDRAAELVVLIRTELDHQDSGFKLRQLDGSAKEFLWNYDGSPKENPEEFVKGIVHWTFMDAAGYVEGLSEQKVDELIKKFTGVISSRIHESSSSLEVECGNVLESLHKKYKELLQSRAEHELNTYTNRGHKHLRILLHHLENSERDLDNLLRQVDGQVKERSRKRKNSRGRNKSETNASANPQTSPQDGSSGANCHSEGTIAEALCDEVPGPSLAWGDYSDPEASDDDEKESVDVETSEGYSSMDGKNTSKGAPILKDEDESKPPQPIERNRSEICMIKVNKVEAEIGDAMKNVRELMKEYDNLHPEEILEGSNAARAVEEVEGLQRRCVHISEVLLNDLSQLDSIDSNSDRVREKRKQNVKNVQSVLGDAESLQEKLRQVHADLIKMKKEDDELRDQEDAKSEEKSSQESTGCASEGSSACSASQEENQKSENNNTLLTRLKTMVIQPHFAMSEALDEYQVSTYVPGLNTDSIDIALMQDNRHIRIRGSRLPNAAELKRLRMSVDRVPIPRAEKKKYSVEDLMLLLAQGRFGSFNTTIALPTDIDSDAVTAKYDNGNLIISIGRKKQSHQPGSRGQKVPPEVLSLLNGGGVSGFSPYDSSGMYPGAYVHTNYPRSFSQYPYGRSQWPLYY